MTSKEEIGKFGEDMAAKYLVSLGWKIIARNIRNNYGEIDAVAVDPKSDELVIVEVRARTVGKTQGPVESVGARKLRTLLRSSQYFIEELGWTGFWRIDVIGLTLRSREAPYDWELEHVRDITTDIFTG